MKAAIPSKGANRLGIGMARIWDSGIARRSSCGLGYHALACNAVDGMSSSRTLQSPPCTQAWTSFAFLIDFRTSCKRSNYVLRCPERYLLRYE